MRPYYAKVAATVEYVGSPFSILQRPSIAPIRALPRPVSICRVITFQYITATKHCPETARIAPTRAW